MLKLGEGILTSTPAENDSFDGQLAMQFQNLISGFGIM
jgi:hypothetical protein